MKTDENRQGAKAAKKRQLNLKLKPQNAPWTAADIPQRTEQAYRMRARRFALWLEGRGKTVRAAPDELALDQQSGIVISQTVQKH